MEIVLSAHSVFLPYLDFVQAYGFKTHEDHHNWTGCRSNITQEPGAIDGSWKYGMCTVFHISQLGQALKLISYVEFCYNLQYMERNNRGQADPWSLRQSGVYQQVSSSTHHSVWIILQPANDVCAQLEQLLKRGTDTDQESEGRAVHFHVVFLSLMASNWQDYLEYLHSQLASLVCGINGCCLYLRTIADNSTS